MSKYKKCIASRKDEDGNPDLSGNIKTPGCRMIYPHLFQPVLPRNETDEKKKKYQVTLLIPKDADISMLKDAVRQARDDKFSAQQQKTSKLRLPFIKTEDEPRFVELADEYPYMIRSNANVGMGPGVVDHMAQAVSEDDAADEVYPGRWCRASLSAYAWDHPQGGKGVSLGLQNIQLLEHDDVLTIAGGKPRATDEFDAAEIDDMGDAGADDDMDDLVG